MFHLFVTSDPDGWNEGKYEYPRDRVIVEYTAPEIVERYRNLTEEKIDELKKFPALFVVENEEVSSKIGYLNDIGVRVRSVVIDFEFDKAFPELPAGSINSIRDEIDLGQYELRRTHWAVKDEKILDILLRANLISELSINRSFFSENTPVQAPPSDGSDYNTNQVFIVHGHDDLMRVEVEAFLKSLNLQPIVLSQQASLGMTIIEKIEHYSNVGFGIVLYTECDIGCKKGAMSQKYRARQNVVFEHGYLIGKLQRNRVAALVKGDVETPNDISGVVYITVNESEGWKSSLISEMREVGYHI